MASRRKFNKARASKYIFCVVMAIIPVVQFLIMGFGVRLHSFVLAFQHYENAIDGLGYDITFAGFDNFVKAIDVFIKKSDMFKNSAILFLICTFFGMTFLLYKKKRLQAFYLSTILIYLQILHMHLMHCLHLHY